MSTFHTLFGEKRLERFPCRGEKQSIYRFGVLHRQGIEFIGKCEHHVEVRNGKQFANPHLHPLLAFVSLTLGAMAISARIVTDVNASAITTFIHMSAQFGSSAFSDCR